MTNATTKKIIVFWSFRSPYSYLALPRLRTLSASTGVELDMRIVHPNILRNPNYFKTMNPLSRPYFMRDTQRTAEFLGMPFRRPIPDPIQQNAQTLDVANEQPLARWLGHLGIAANEAGRGFDFCLEVSRLLWDGATDHWHEGDHLKEATARAGLTWSSLSAQVSARPDYFEQQLQVNADALTAAGHWGVPTMVYGDDTFFGQDRIEVLAWCVKKASDSVPLI